MVFNNLQVIDFQRHKQRYHPQEKKVKRSDNIELDALESHNLIELQQEYKFTSSLFKWSDISLDDLPQSYQDFHSICVARYKTQTQADPNQYSLWLLRHFQRVSA